MDDSLDLSIIIGFKDWGLERLELSIKTIQKSLSGKLRGEVIVSDYGSVDGESVRQVAERLNARCIRTETDGEWSRSRALNAGIRSSSGRWVFTTDADMLFTPETFPALVEWLESHPGHAAVLQCRDLPAGHSHEVVRDRGLLWDEFERRAKLRPRWGMGGLFGVSRYTLNDVGGYDERMHTYGGEDLDFALRVRRSGAPVTWIEDRRVRMYHVWHPSTHAVIKRQTGGNEAVRENQLILKEDQSWVRNVTRGSTRSITEPLASFVTVMDAPAAGLPDTVFSALGQTVDSVECLIVHPDNVPLDLVFANISGIVDVVVPAGTPVEVMYAEAIKRARGRWVAMQPPGTTSMSDRVETLLGIIRGGEAGAWSGIAVIDVEARAGQRVLPRSPLEGSSRSWVDGMAAASLFLRTDLLRRALEPLGGKVALAQFGEVVAAAGLNLSRAQQALVGVWAATVDESVEAEVVSHASIASLRATWAGRTQGDDEQFPAGRRELLELSPASEVRRSGAVQLPPGVDPDAWLSGISAKVRIWTEQDWRAGQSQTTLRFDDLSRRDLAQIRQVVPGFEPLIEWAANERGDSVSRRRPITEIIGSLVSEIFRASVTHQVLVAASQEREDLEDLMLTLEGQTVRALTIVTDEIKLHVLLVPGSAVSAVKESWTELVRRRNTPGSRLELVQIISQSSLPGQLEKEIAVLNTRSKAVEK
ncbi:glycosyltransferase family 2 protein [Kocuria sp. CPCC 205297]|uniref:glycosyltransferase family 2 protein n=1 Tax=Kocuria sp. CPCC 205297 TaxID=3073558 RepID=UPI0034D4659A